MVNSTEKEKVAINPLLTETFLQVIKNSLGTRMFQNYYADIDGEKRDIMKGGEVSCAFFVTGITSMFNLTKKIHGTVDGAVYGLLDCGWKEVEKPEIGAILVWEEMEFNGEWHKHIGFYIGEGKAISNDCVTKVPAEHDWTYSGKRKIIKVLWNGKLGSTI